MHEEPVLSLDDLVTRLCVVNHTKVRFGYDPATGTFTCIVYYANTFFEIIRTTGRSAVQAAQSALDWIEGRG
jgi:hypothetical protein